MLLSDLTAKAGISYSGKDADITGLTADSRKASAGFLFAALSGVKADGAAYLADAKEAGAVAAVVDEKADLPDTGLLYVKVPDPRAAFAKLAAAFYGKQPATIVAVTGTNGKTSIANFCRQLWESAGKKAASIGTLGVLSDDYSSYFSMTTPDPVTLHKELATLAEHGVSRAAIEASSHGIDQHRIDGIALAAAGFTNITRDHLDYHKTMENYLNAKLGLFDRPLTSNHVVLNADIDEYPQIRDFCRERKLTVLDYGKKADALRIVSAQSEAHGQKLELSVFNKPYTVHLPLAGTFQAMNALCALGLVLSVMDKDESVDAYVNALSKLKGAPGRLEFIGAKANGAAVYVDYAHTPDAIETVLNALRPHTAGKLRVVFGCGGDRDTGKRPQMGELADKLADVVYVTDDNPRSEEPAAIRAAILSACPKGINIGSRALAIETAVKDCEEGDVLVIAGKGHETGQTVKGVVHPFDDREEAEKALKKADEPLWTAEEIAEATNGRAGSDFPVYGVSIDTRTLKKGDLYIAIKGERTDGHAYAKQALEQGAAGVLVSDLSDGLPIAKVIAVADTTDALKALASAARNRSGAKVVGVTGSSGKTSTKEMLKAALSAVGRTHATAGNLNNNIGLPLMLARMPKDTDFAVLEMGISHVGEMAEMTAIARPDIAIVTMIGNAHAAFFKKREDIATAKAEIFSGMGKDGIVFLNGDDSEILPVLTKEAKKAGLSDIRTFGLIAEDDAALIHLSELNGVSNATVRIGGSTYSYDLNLPGKHQVMNSLAVVGALEALGVDMASALQSLGRLMPTAGRGARLRLPCAGGTFTLIDDAYNANPESMAAAVAVLGGLTPDGKGRRIAVLGDMLELGEKALEFHLGLKEKLEAAAVDAVFAAGENCSALFDALPDAMRGGKAPTSELLAPAVLQAVRPDDIVLVKGSFGSKMRVIIDVLKTLSTENNG